MKVYLISIIKKIIDTVTSVKVLTIVGCLAISTHALYAGKLTGDVWATFNGGVIVAVYGMREAFKVAKVKSSDNSEDIKI